MKDQGSLRASPSVLASRNSPNSSTDGPAIPPLDEPWGAAQTVRALRCFRREDGSTYLVRDGVNVGDVIDRAASVIIDLDMTAMFCGMVREAAKEVFGGNYTFADGDLTVLKLTARRAIEAGLTDHLHPTVAAKALAALAALSEGQP